MSRPLCAQHLAFFVLAGIELALVVGVATFFSSFTTPVLAAFFTIGVWSVGHLSRQLRDLGTIAAGRRLGQDGHVAQGAQQEGRGAVQAQPHRSLGHHLDHDIRRLLLEGTAEERAILQSTDPAIRTHYARVAAYEQQLCQGS